MYPEDFRAEYEEEIIGVLLAAEMDGRRRLGEMMSLVLHGLLNRVRGLRPRVSGDALAVVGLIAPLVMFGWGIAVEYGPRIPAITGPGAPLVPLNGWGVGEPVPLWAVWPAALVLAFTRRRQLAAVVAVAGAGYDIYQNAVVQYSTGSGMPEAGWRWSFELLAVVALAQSADVRLGLAILVRSNRRWMLLSAGGGLMCAAIAFALGERSGSIVSFDSDWYWPACGVLLTGVLVGLGRPALHRLAAPPLMCLFVATPLLAAGWSPPSWMVWPYAVMPLIYGTPVIVASALMVMVSRRSPACVRSSN